MVFQPLQTLLNDFSVNESEAYGLGVLTIYMTNRYSRVQPWHEVLRVCRASGMKGG